MSPLEDLSHILESTSKTGFISVYEAATLTPDEVEERRQRFVEKAGMTPEEYRKKADPCRDIHLSFEAALLASDTNEKREEETMEVVSTIVAGHCAIVVLSSDESVQPGMSLVQNGKAWFIQKKVDHGNGWILQDGRIGHKNAKGMPKCKEAELLLYPNPPWLVA